MIGISTRCNMSTLLSSISSGICFFRNGTIVSLYISTTNATDNTKNRPDVVDNIADKIPTIARPVIQFGNDSINKCKIAVSGGTSGNIIRDRKSTRLNSSHVSISYAV